MCHRKSKKFLLKNIFEFHEFLKTNDDDDGFLFFSLLYYAYVCVRCAN